MSAKIKKDIAFDSIGEGFWFALKGQNRIGVVVGGNRVYNAERLSGQYVGTKSTKRAAAELLLAAE